jgi:hypothetical protein
MSERNIILRDPQNRNGQTFNIRTTYISRLMNYLIEKFDRLAASFYKFTNSEAL